MWDVAAQPSSPEGESEAKLFVSTNQTRAGIVADCGHKFPPTGGAFNPQQQLCRNNGIPWQDVSGDYSYYLPAPPRPAGATHLTYRAVDQGSSGAPGPTLTPEGSGVRATFHLTTVGPGAQYPSGQALAMYYTIYAGWDALPAALVPTHLHISFDSLGIHRAMDPGCTPASIVPGCTDQSTSLNQASTAPGEWNMFYDVSGVWGRWGNGEFDVIDGAALTGNQSVDLYVPPGQGWQLLGAGASATCRAWPLPPP